MILLLPAWNFAHRTFPVQKGDRSLFNRDNWLEAPTQAHGPWVPGSYDCSHAICLSGCQWRQFPGKCCFTKRSLQQVWKEISDCRTLRLLGSLSKVLSVRKDLLNWACQHMTCAEWRLLDSYRNNVHLAWQVERTLAYSGWWGNDDPSDLSY